MDLCKRKQNKHELSLILLAFCRAGIAARPEYMSLVIHESHSFIMRADHMVNASAGYSCA